MGIQTAVGNNIYRLGDHGLVVEEIQHALHSVGYALSGTGYFGPATDVAVSLFQRRCGLPDDGKFGPRTAKALDAAMIDVAATHPSVVPTTPAQELCRPLWLEAGLKLIGTKEVPGGGDSKTIINWASEEGGDIAKEYDHDSIPWCALFANHILTHVGIKGTETLWALDFAGKWPSVQLRGPAVGAFAPMLRNGGGHIICIVGRDQNDRIMGLGGNQSDQVSVVPFPLTRLNRGFWWPEGVPVPNLIGVSSLPIVHSDGRVSTKET